ncbi:MAG TPA: 50S ribosomal protein L31e [Methanothermococcus okinawensis]|uniref:Large ribosomal subunit protein eL31 n=1 Tax=Methanothermococcus okinawensis TaxID=155863 RepID=A0A833EBR4_9EURY|nr:50S ribosomal protein L31e [Methanothermococcus okinawensis]
MEERIYTIPLRDVTNRSRATKRAPRAIKKIREFLKRHTKCEVIKLDKSINEKIWERGISKIPPRIRVKVIKEEENVAKAILVE